MDHKQKLVIDLLIDEYGTAPLILVEAILDACKDCKHPREQQYEIGDIMKCSLCNTIVEDNDSA